MFTINSINGNMVNVTFDGAGDPKEATRKNAAGAAFYPKTLNLAGAPTDDKDVLLQFCSDGERAYYEGWVRSDTAAPSDISALVGKKQATLPALPDPEPEAEAVVVPG